MHETTFVMEGFFMESFMQKARAFYQLAQEEIRENPGDTVLIIVALYVITVGSLMAAVL